MRCALALVFFGIVVASAQTKPAAAPEQIIVSKVSYDPAFDPELYLADMTGKVLRRLPLRGYFPAFSRDGKKLAFAGQHGDKCWCLQIADDPFTTSTAITKKTDFDYVSSPSWYPDGEQIAFAGTKKNHDSIYVVNLRSKELRQLQANASRPSVSPDGKSVAFQMLSGNNLQIFITVNDAAPRQLTTGKSESSAPMWSPDGRWLAFVSNRIGPRFAVYVMDPAGGNVRRVIYAPQTDFCAPAWSSSGDSTTLAAEAVAYPDNGKPEYNQPSDFTRCGSWPGNGNNVLLDLKSGKLTMLPISGGKVVTFRPQ